MQTELQRHKANKKKWVTYLNKDYEVSSLPSYFILPPGISKEVSLLVFVRLCFLQPQILLAGSSYRAGGYFPVYCWSYSKENQQPSSETATDPRDLFSRCVLMRSARVVSDPVMELEYAEFEIFDTIYATLYKV